MSDGPVDGLVCKVEGEFAYIYSPFYAVDQVLHLPKAPVGLAVSVGLWVSMKVRDNVVEWLEPIKPRLPTSVDDSGAVLLKTVLVFPPEGEPKYRLNGACWSLHVGRVMFLEFPDDARVNFAYKAWIQSLPETNNSKDHLRSNWIFMFGEALIDCENQSYVNDAPWNRASPLGFSQQSPSANNSSAANLRTLEGVVVLTSDKRNYFLVYCHPEILAVCANSLSMVSGTRVAIKAKPASDTTWNYFREAQYEVCDYEIIGQLDVVDRTYRGVSIRCRCRIPPEIEEVVYDRSFVVDGLGRVFDRKKLVLVSMITRDVVFTAAWNAGFPNEWLLERIIEVDGNPVDEIYKTNRRLRDGDATEELIGVTGLVCGMDPHYGDAFVYVRGLKLDVSVPFRFFPNNKPVLGEWVKFSARRRDRFRCYEPVERGTALMNTNVFQHFLQVQTVVCDSGETLEEYSRFFSDDVGYVLDEAFVLRARRGTRRSPIYYKAWVTPIKYHLGCRFKLTRNVMTELNCSLQQRDQIKATAPVPANTTRSASRASRGEAAGDQEDFAHAETGSNTTSSSSRSSASHGASKHRDSAFSDNSAPESSRFSADGTHSVETLSVCFDRIITNPSVGEKIRTEMPEEYETVRSFLVQPRSFRR